MLVSILSIISVLFAQSGPSCQEFLNQISQKTVEQKKVEEETQKLDEQLKIALQNEITAQVEKRDSSSEQGQATQIYYELRKAWVQKKHILRTIKELKTEHCRMCPESNSCSEGRTRS